MLKFSFNPPLKLYENLLKFQRKTFFALKNKGSLPCGKKPLFFVLIIDLP